MKKVLNSRVITGAPNQSANKYKKIILQESEKPMSLTLQDEDLS